MKKPHSKVLLFFSLFLIFELEFVTFLPFYVIPAWGERESTLWIPAFAGMTTPGVAEGCTEWL